MKTELLRRCTLCHSSALVVLDSDCNVVQCSTCGYIFDNPRPVAEELIRFYSQPAKYDLWLNQLGLRERVWRSRLKILEGTRKPGSLLDVGAGIDEFLSLARSSYGEVFRTEVSSTAVQIAKQKYDLELFQGTTEDLATLGKTFDNITLFHVLEHVPDPKSTLRTCYSLLSEGGILVIAVPNEVTSLRVRLKRALTKLGPRSGTALVNSVCLSSL